MTKTIAALWNGNIAPVESFGLNNPEIQRLEGLMLRNIEKREKDVGETARAVLKAYLDCVDDYTFLICKQAFCDGFCLGTRLAVEALTGAEQQTE